MDTIVIREFESTAEDRQRVDDFFAAFDDVATEMFNRGDGSHIAAMRFFDDPAADLVSHLRMMAVNGAGEMVGYINAAETDTGVPGIGLAVSAACRGQGVGMKMIHVMWDVLRSRGAGGMWLCTYHHNTAAQHLYEKFGFEHMGDYLDGEKFYLFRQK